MDFGQIELEIVGHLQSKMADDRLSIIPIPENDIEVLAPAGKRQIIVAFASEEANPDNNLSIIPQHSVLTFSILLQGKLLRGVTGLYGLAESVKKCLMGYCPLDCAPRT